MRLDLHATPAEVMRAVDTLRDFGMAQGVPEKRLFGLTLALEECGTNIVNYALNRDPSRQFQVVIDISAGILTVELRDEGPPFDPTQQLPPPSMANDDLPPGGWGIQLARRHVDKMLYAREINTNVLRLMCRLSSPE